jgi:hypothetical protein
VVPLQNQAPPSTAPGAPVAAPGAAVVKITGIPASMTGSSIFDCLQQLLGEFTHKLRFHHISPMKILS